MSESYSKLSTFEQCPYKYKLIYLDNNYIKDDSIATEFGTLVHHIEEEIGKSLKYNKVKMIIFREDLHNEQRH